MSYVGLRINITDECADICESNEINELFSQKDCFKNNIKGVYYAFDDRVQTCFSFDPRDEKKAQLYSYVSKEEKRKLNIDNKRELQNGSCATLKDCFTCEGATASLCAWNGGQCG